MNKRSGWLLAFTLVLMLGLIGCQSSNQQTADNQSTTPESTAKSGGKEKGRRHENKAEKGQQAAGAANEQPPAPQTVTIPSGTELSVTLDSGISSGTATSGAAFTGTLSGGLVVNGTEVVPAGSAVAGQVTNAVSSGRLNRPAELSLTLTSLTPKGGQAITISTDTWSASGASHKKRDAALIGGGAGVGALVGALAGKGKGAAIGALVGGGAGTAGAAATGKKEIVLASESKLTFKLTAPITLTM
jgi:hypothetical protein